MKLQTLALRSLKAMAKSYKQSGRQLFDLNFFTEHFPKESAESISIALYLLEKDRFVSIQSGDGLAYMTTLSPDGIRKSQENTILKMGYLFFKELLDLIK